MTQKEFTELVERYEKLIYTVCFQFTRDHFAAQDLTQETFLTAYTHIDACDPASYRPWLTRIAANKSKDYLKSAAYRRESPVEEFPEAPPSELSSPERLALDQAGAEALQSRILALKEPYREPAALYFLEELPPGEISRRLNRPEKTIYTQLSRAKIMLKNELNGKEAPHDKGKSSPE